MNQKDWKLFIWILIAVTFLVSIFAIGYFIYVITFVPPEEIVINFTEFNLE